MVSRRRVEVWVGAFIAAGMAALFMLAMKVSNLAAFTSSGGYEVTAYFDNIGGLKVRSPVTLAGVKVGRVSYIGYDETRYQAMVKMMIDTQYNRLPVDTTASIFTSGLLGEQYVSLDPGAEEQYLAQGDVIKLTQSALVIEQLIGQYLFSKAGEGGSGGAPGATAGTHPAQ